MNDKESKNIDLKWILEEISSMRREISVGISSLKETDKKIAKIEKSIKKRLRPKIEYNKEYLENIYEELTLALEEQGDAGFELKVKSYQSNSIIALALIKNVPGGKKLSLKKAEVGIKDQIQRDKILTKRIFQDGLEFK